MKVKVRFAGTMRNFADRQELTLQLTESTSLRGLLVELNAILPDEFTQQILSPILTENANASALLMINRKQINNLNQLDQVLKDGDSIVFVPPMEGG